MAALGQQLKTLSFVKATAPAEPALTGRPLIETFRLLALNLRQTIAHEDRRAIAVISAWPGDGRSLVSFCLARALAELMPPILIVDADPTGSGIEGFLGSAMWNGNGHSPDERLALGNYPVNQVSGNANLRVLVPPRNWAKVPRSPIVFIEELSSAIRLATDQGITVVVDTPACTSSSIPFHLAGNVTGLLYVARQRMQDSRTHHDIRAQLDLLGGRVFGVVFNEA